MAAQQAKLRDIMRMSSFILNIIHLGVSRLAHSEAIGFRKMNPIHFRLTTKISWYNEWDSLWHLASKAREIPWEEARA